MERQTTSSADEGLTPIPTVNPVPMAALVPSAVLFPLQLLTGWTCVNPNETVAISHCGLVTKVLDEPGCYPIVMAGKEERRVSTKETAVHIDSQKIVDATGTPVMVSAIINYKVVEPLKAIFSVQNYRNNVLLNAQAVLKHVVGTHTYQELRTGAEKINRDLLAALRPTMVRSGVQVLEMKLNEMNYAPEVAAAMLKRQQAAALVEARQLIVEGAVRIAEDAIKKLEANKVVTISDADKVKIVTNLLTVTCSDAETTPTVSV